MEVVKDFKDVRELIKKYDIENIKPLKDCPKTIAQFKEESKSGNPYRTLAKRFVEYENGTGEDSKDTDDWYFYQYLKSLNRSDKYIFPVEGGSFTVTIDLFKPYDEETQIIDPRWHLLVSYYAYIDAAYNHPDNEYARQISVKNPKVWKPGKTIMKCFCNNVLKAWMDEALKEDTKDSK